MKPRTPEQVRGVLTRKRWDPSVVFYEGSRDCRKLDAELIRRSLPLLGKTRWAGKDVRALVAAVEGLGDDEAIVATWGRAIDALRTLYGTSPIGTDREREKLIAIARDEVVVRAMHVAVAEVKEADPSWTAVFSAHGSRKSKAIVREQMRGDVHPKLVEAIASFANAASARSSHVEPAAKLPTGKMTRADFWALIDRASDATDPTGTLGDWLRELPPEQVRVFDRHFTATMKRAYRYDLWGAAYLLLGRCSDDGFTDFCADLILHGKKTFERVLRQPDLLAEHPDIEGDESIASLAATVYEELTDGELRESGDWPARPAGRKLSFSERSLAKRYPRIAAVVAERSPLAVR